MARSKPRPDAEQLGLLEDVYAYVGRLLVKHRGRTGDSLFKAGGLSREQSKALLKRRAK